MFSLAGVAALAILASGHAWGVAGSGVVKEETRQVAAFHRVRVSQGLEADVSQSGQASVVVRGDDNLVALVKTDVENGVLVIHMVEGSHGFHSELGLKVTVKAPALDGVSASSGGHLKLTEASGSVLDVQASSGSAVEAAGLNEGVMKVDASSGSEIKLAGKAKEVRLECSAGSNVKAGELSAEAVRVEGSSGATVQVTASSSVRGSLSAGSHLSVHGSPSVREISTSSGGSYDFEGAREL
jgi:hypothetical protein